MRAEELKGHLDAVLLVGLVLITVIGLLAIAALGPHYRLAVRAGVAGCLGLTLLDIAMITGVVLAVSSVTWIMVAAMAASAVRVAGTTRVLRPVLSG